jgi:2-polyprenyl-3-methyl-5-hydroxy-6-metoxy-1,4-benzoquinol methylase
MGRRKLGLCTLVLGTAYPQHRAARVPRLGARRGGLSLWMAAKGHHVTCSDIESPRETARPLHDKYGVTGRIRYEALNAAELPYRDRFDLIVFKSVLGAVGAQGGVERQRTAVQQIYQA